MPAFTALAAALTAARLQQMLVAARAAPARIAAVTAILRALFSFGKIRLAGPSS
jgi:hypothetical protein